MYTSIILVCGLTICTMPNMLTTQLAGKAQQQAPEATASDWQLRQVPARRMRI